MLVASGVLLAVILRGTFLASGRAWTDSLPPPPPDVPAAGSFPSSFAPSRPLATGRHLTLWWDTLPASLEDRAVRPGGQSNVRPVDYSGPDSCKECHPKNHDSWSKHPHRWMNALAGPTTVQGDFADASISYRGGRATFSRRGDKYVMHLERGAVRRTYDITQTIGSRFYQYYVGKQVEGPEAPGHHFYTRDHVLPFGYWLDQKEWVPVVHIGPEVRDEDRPDPYDPPDDGPYYADYAVGCNQCHTTFALADLFGRGTPRIGEYAPLPLHWSMRPYLAEAHPDTLRAVESGELSASSGAPHPALSTPDGRANGQTVDNPLAGWEAPRYAVTLGVSCEACHLGTREHVDSKGAVPPKFFPSSPHLAVEAEGKPLDFGPTHDNVNWACGRCHVGVRPQFAAGMSTWNSVEYSDAMRGSCYSKLRCVDCHNPHRAIGPKWSLTADQDDALCLKCHEQLRPAGARLQHTHHPAGSAGARCMNCHMPRINEGVQDVVRTHMIYSPTRAAMIEANQPNACNLCHTDRPIDWTLGFLRQWYGVGYDEAKIKANCPDRAAPAAQGWLKSSNASVRLVAAEALTRARDSQALPQLLDALDDPYLINRQFAAKGLQEMLHRRLADSGYRFYMTSEERRQPLAELRAEFSHATGPKAP
jgi:predicted CXXCH cytochrome family protein